MSEIQEDNNKTISNNNLKVVVSVYSDDQAGCIVPNTKIVDITDALKEQKLDPLMICGISLLSNDKPSYFEGEHASLYTKQVQECMYKRFEEIADLTFVNNAQRKAFMNSVARILAIPHKATLSKRFFD